MIKKLQHKFSESATVRWTVLVLVSFTMLTGYILSDVMAPLKTMLEQQLGWNSSDYGLYTMGYGIFNIFLLMLIFAGMILDKKGARFTGVLAVVLMMIGAVLQYRAFAAPLSDDMVAPVLFGWQIFSMKAQVFFAMVGFGIFGVGVEMVGITANKVVVKWFRGRSLALALGLNVAAGRIGTAIAMFGAYPFAKSMGSPASPLLLCMIMLCIGLVSFLVFGVMDRRYDREIQSDEAQGIADGSIDAKAEEEAFKPSDIFAIAKIRAFWYITLLCLLFYSAVFPFLKYATELMIQKFHFSTSFAGMVPALLPFGNILLTPLFGSIYDRKGHGATIMIIGAALLVFVHLMLAVPFFTGSWVAIAMMILLGAAFSLVPSAMWPSVPKIIPDRMLGTAYSMIFWIQNWGLAFVPMIIGTVLNRYCIIGEISVDGAPTTAYSYTVPMLIFAGFGVMSIFVAILLKREDAKKGYGLEKPNIQR